MRPYGVLVRDVGGVDPYGGVIFGERTHAVRPYGVLVRDVEGVDPYGDCGIGGTSRAPSPTVGGLRLAADARGAPLRCFGAGRRGC